VEEEEFPHRLLRGRYHCGRRQHGGRRRGDRSHGGRWCHCY